MKIERTQNAVRNALWGIFSKCVTGVFPVIMRAVIVYYLGAEYLGLSTLFSSILSVLSLADLGLPGAIVFSMYKPIAEDDSKTICELLSFYRKAYIAIGSAIAIIGLLVMPSLRQLINGECPQDVNIYILYLIYLFNAVIGYFLFAYKGCLFEAYQRNDLQVKISMITITIQHVLCIPMLIVTRNYYTYALSIPVASIVNNIMISYAASKSYPKLVPNGKLEKDERQKLRKSIGGLMLSRISGVTRNTFDSIFISAFIGLTAVTMYGNYYYLMSTVVALVSVVVSGMRAGIGNSVAVESQEKNYKDFTKFTFLYAWVIGWCTICLACLYQTAMRIWMGKELLLSNDMVLLFCLYFYSLQSFTIMDQYYDAVGLWWIGKWRTILEITANLAFNYLFVRFWGLEGIVLATIITTILVNFIYGTLILFRNYFTSYSVKPYFESHLKYFVGTCFVGIITYGSCSLIPEHGFITLFFKGLICIVEPNFIYLLLYRKNSEAKEALLFAKKILRNKIE